MTMERDESNAIILNYLRRMGYRQSEKIFKDEANAAGLETLAFELRSEHDSSIANYLLFSKTASADVAAYDTAYEALHKWIYESLDAFRDELIPVLYPLLVHSYLDILAKGATKEARAFLEKHKTEHLLVHEDELVKLEALTEPSHVKENPLAVAFRGNKYNVTMSAYAFQLLMNFLQDPEFASGPSGNGNVILLKIINQFVNIRVLVAKSGSAAAGPANAATGLSGVAAERAVGMNRAKIQWGVNIVDPAIESALQQRAKTEGRLNEILHGPLAQLKRIYTQTSLQAPPTDRIPKPTPGAAETNAEIDRLRHLAKKANLSALSLPSICFYTLQNAHQGVTSIDFAPTATAMATGNRDSYIDIWSLNHEPLRAIRPSTELAAMDLNDCKGERLIGRGDQSH